MERGVARLDPARVTPKVKLYVHSMFYVSLSKDLSGQSIVFGLFRPDMNTEMGVIIYVY